MNIFEKLQTIRCILQKEKFKKSGKNTYAGYEYFELGDFLPRINELMLEHKLCSNISFGSDMAVLTIVNIDKSDEQITFTSPMSEAALKGCHAVQNLGAVQTYLRRYLYVNAFEIVEHDALDGTTGKDTSSKQEKTESKGALSDAQIKRAYAIAKGNNLTEDAIKKWIKGKYNKDSVKDLTKTEYDVLCEALEKPKEAS
jgi:hypothetical protein